MSGGGFQKRGNKVCKVLSFEAVKSKEEGDGVLQY